jgi:hypothetical protein
MFQQNCYYTTQGDMICKELAKAKPVLAEYPEKNDIFIENFSQTKVPDAVKNLKGNTLVFDPSVLQNCKTSSFETESKKLITTNLVNGNYSCDPKNCKLDSSNCTQNTNNKDIWNCDVVCDNCCNTTKDGKKICKPSYSSKTTGRPITIKSDGTPPGTNYQPCVTINNKSNTSLDVNKGTCQKLTYSDIGDMMAKCASKTPTTTTEGFLDFAPVLQDTQPPFYDQRVFKSFWF